jgi:exodeoxyribonuclease VII large subunit
MVEGEITGISHAHSGHCYFNLMDEEASISCAFFRQDLMRHPGFKNIKEGDRVLVYGPLSVYQKRGSFQILAKRVMPAGEGLWKLRFEALKKKLQAEGIFDPERKRPLPTFPKRIALITAPGGAALHDFLNVYQRRGLNFEIVIIPALVQGDKAPASLIRALELAESKGDFDVVVFARGGGSPEDLWCFNDEQLIRRMSRCPMPIVSAVGHEVDWTLSDHVADLRCETPTAAAEILSQPQTILHDRLMNVQRRLVSQMRQRQSEWRHLILRYRPSQLLNLLMGRLHAMQMRLERLNVLNRVHQYLPLHEKSVELDELFARMEESMAQKILGLTQRLERAQVQVESMSPYAVLGRGYAIAEGPAGVVSSKQDWDKLPLGAELKLAFKDGRVSVSKDKKD